MVGKVIGWNNWRASAGIEARRPNGSTTLDNERLLGGNGTVVVGCEGGRCAGARILLRALIIQLDTWLMLSPVALHNCFFSSSLGYG